MLLQLVGFICPYKKMEILIYLFYFFFGFFSIEGKKNPSILFEKQERREIKVIVEIKRRN